MRNEDIEWKHYKDELYTLVGECEKLPHMLLDALFDDDFLPVKHHLEILEQRAINAVLEKWEYGPDVF